MSNEDDGMTVTAAYALYIDHMQTLAITITPIHKGIAIAVANRLRPAIMEAVRAELEAAGVEDIQAHLTVDGPNTLQ